MEYWSIGVLRQVRIAPRVRRVGDAERAAKSRYIQHLHPLLYSCGAIALRAQDGDGLFLAAHRS
jgi:hypothetical protein